MPKKETPKDDSIWDAGNPRPLLRLITCDPTTPVKGGHYVGNWVVWAVPRHLSRRQPALRGAVALSSSSSSGGADPAPALGHQPGGGERHPGDDEGASGSSRPWLASSERSVTTTTSWPGTSPRQPSR